MFIFDKVKRFLMAPIRFAMSAQALITAVLDVVVFIVIAVVVNVYVIGNQTLFNTTVGAPGYAITSVVVPLLQVFILIGCILAAIFLLPKMAKSRGK